MRIHKALFFLVASFLLGSCKQHSTQNQETFSQVLTSLPSQESPDFEFMFNVGSMVRHYQTHLKAHTDEYMSSSKYMSPLYRQHVSWLVEKIFSHLSQLKTFRLQVKVNDHTVELARNLKEVSSPASYQLLDPALGRFLPQDAMVKMQGTFALHQKVPLIFELIGKSLNIFKPELEKPVMDLLLKWKSTLEGSTFAIAFDDSKQNGETPYFAGIFLLKDPNTLLDMVEHTSEFVHEQEKILDPNAEQKKKENPDITDSAPMALGSSPKARHFAMWSKGKDGQRTGFEFVIFQKYVLFQVGKQSQMLQKLATAIEKNDVHLFEAMKIYPLGGTFYADINAQKLEQSYDSKKEGKPATLQNLSTTDATISVIQYGNPDDEWLRVSFPMVLLEQAQKDPRNPFPMSVLTNMLPALAKNQSETSKQ